MDVKCKSCVFLWIQWAFLAMVQGKCLMREPPDIMTPPAKDDAGFYLTVSGNPEHYEPGNLYTVSLRVSKPQQSKLIKIFTLIVCTFVLCCIVQGWVEKKERGFLLCYESKGGLVSKLHHFSAEILLVMMTKIPQGD